MSIIKPRFHVRTSQTRDQFNSPSKQRLDSIDSKSSSTYNVSSYEDHPDVEATHIHQDDIDRLRRGQRDRGESRDGGPGEGNNGVDIVNLRSWMVQVQVQSRSTNS